MNRTVAYGVALMAGAGMLFFLGQSLSPVLSCRELQQLDDPECIIHDWIDITATAVIVIGAAVAGWGGMRDRRGKK